MQVAFSVAVQSDGRIVAAGWSSNGTNRDFALVRYTDSGALDTSFGTGGIVTTPIGSSDESGNGVAVQSDGKIVVAGVSSTGSNQVIALVRYTDTGALDPSFGTGGKVTTALGGTFDLANSVVLQSDGKIVVAGDSVQVGSFDVALVRYTAGGALDVDFGKGGMVTTSIGSSDDTGQKVVVQEDGKIVIVGATWEGTNTHIALLRYTTDGALDPNFGTGGIVTTDFGDSSVGSDLAVQADAKIVVAGWTWNGSNRDFALARYTTSGALDAGFGIAGKATTDLGGRDDYGFGVAVQSDGKIVVAGFSQPGGRDAIAFTDRLLSPSGTVWNSLSTVKLDGQGIGVITDLPAAPVRFYRAVAP